jgi:hypothetical protein
VDYKQYAKWTKANTYFVTRLKDNAVYKQLDETAIPIIILKTRYKDENEMQQLLILHRVVYYDKDKDRILAFITSIIELTAE